MSQQDVSHQQEAFSMKPMVAEIELVKPVNSTDVWGWLTKGWQDFRATWQVGATYAASFTLLGFFISFGFYFMELPYLILPALSGFLLVGPALGVGFYEISRRRAAGEQVRMIDPFKGFMRNPLGTFGLGMGLVFLFQVWIRTSFTIAAISFPGVGPDMQEMAIRAVTSNDGIVFTLLAGGIGFCFAASVFITCAFAMPLMVDRKTVLVPAMFTSAVAVFRNRSASMLWAALIVGFMFIGLLPLGLGLIITFPIIGHATWHSYQQVIGEGAPLPPRD